MSLTRYFRQARPASARWNLCKTLVQSIVFWTVFLALLPVCLVWLERQLGLSAFEFPGQVPTGILLFLLASGLNVWSGATMAVVGCGTPLPTDCPRRLVVAGPYRWVRNPMAIGGLGQGLGVAIAVGSGLMIVAVAAGGLLWNYAVRPTEESHLQECFGGEYGEYCQQVRCWIPRRAAYRPSIYSPREKP